MRAVGIPRTGGPEVIELIDRPVREPADGEVRIRVRAAAVNPTDIGLRQRGGGDDLPPPWTPGADAAGVVEAVGPGVSRVRIGDEVMAVLSPRRPEGGAQAELLVVGEASVVAIPEGVSLAQAATLPMNGLTAELGLEMLALRGGQTLAVSGGAGLLASYVIPLAKRQGIRVIADAKPEEEAQVAGYGADLVVPRGEKFVEAVKEAAPEGVDGFFDTALLGRDAFPVVGDGGGFAVVRGWDDAEMPERGIRIHKVMVFSVLDRTDWLLDLRDLASAGDLVLRVAGEYPPERAADAQRAMEAGGLRGRAVIVF